VAEEFVNPPIIELVIGAQFSPLIKFTSGHFGLFWKELGEEWGEPQDAPLLEDQFELFGQSSTKVAMFPSMRLEPLRLPGRFLLRHRDQSRLLQIQTTRFHLNWRKRGVSYPSYRQLIKEFEEKYSQFILFTKQADVGEPVPNQWELTYVDAFLKDEYWHTPDDWYKFLPGLFSPLFPTTGLELILEQRTAQWSYEIAPQKGRLHIVAGLGYVSEDKRLALLLQMTARGPVGREGGAETLRQGLDMGHEVAVEVFLRVTSEEAKQRWRTKI
jgi:uncharacterized protein (TIGR04255 family)